MNKHINAKFLMAAIAALFLFGAFNMTFAQGIGAKYGTRDPQTCADTKAPGRGAMTAALATKYVICATEGVQAENLYLVEDLAIVQVGGSRPYNHKNDSVPDIDVTAPVYPFRAESYKQYQCGIVNEGNKGYNCAVYPHSKATGACRKTTFGDWNCTFDYQTGDSTQFEFNVPPPTGAKGGATDKANAATKNNNQTAAAKADTNDNDLPPPDFSEVEKYYDISKIEYSPADHVLYFIGKMTQKINPGEFRIDFYDADDIKVIPTNYVLRDKGDIAEVGDIAKFYGYLPDESKWKYVKRVVITRKKQ